LLIRVAAGQRSNSLRLRHKFTQDNDTDDSDSTYVSLNAASVDHMVTFVQPIARTNSASAPTSCFYRLSADCYQSHCKRIADFAD
jgi:hypothetical protein